MTDRRSFLGALAATAGGLMLGCRPDRAFAPSLSLSDLPFTLVGAGDQHAKEAGLQTRLRTAEMVQSVLDADPGALAFNAGDITQNGTAQEITDYYEPTWGRFRDRTLFTMGNHDRLNGTADNFYQYTGLVRDGYYARNLGEHWRLYVLNSESASAGGADAAEQTAWLRADIEAHPGLHRLAMWHIPMFSNECATNLKPMTWPGKVGVWWEILQQNGGELVLSGHAHRWERFAKALRSGERSSQGLRQFVVGTGGVQNMGVLSRHPLYEAAVVERGVARFELYPEAYSWTFTDLAGAVRDQGEQLCRAAV